MTLTDIDCLTFFPEVNLPFEMDVQILGTIQIEGFAVGFSSQEIWEA